jgi:hypothetical protein
MEGGSMYASMRRYDLGAGSRGMGAVKELTRRCKEELVPTLSALDGFTAYYVVDTGNGIISSVSIFEHEAGADEGNKLVKHFYRERLQGLLQANPQVTEGPAIVHQP